MADLTFLIDGYNFTMPASSYIIDFSQGDAGTHLFNNSCAFMVMP